MIEGERVQTPYSAMTTPEIVEARRSLAALYADDESQTAVGDLVVWATIELAERLSAFVEHADGSVFGLALEALAFDLGIVRGERPKRSPSNGNGPPPVPPVPPPFAGRQPVPLRRSGGRRGH